MILSNTAILKALDEGRLIIEPEPAPRSPGEGVDCPYNTSSVDLRTSNEFSVPKGDRPFRIDLTKGKYSEYYNAENYDAVVVPEGQIFNLESGKVALVRTAERVAFPIVKGKLPLAGRIEGRSSWARCGLLVHFTAPTIHAGWDGPIILELCNLGPAPLSLVPGARICQLIVEQVEGVPFRNQSQFHQQMGPGGKKSRKGSS
ncbi:MAG: dCTP deaminase [Planctomycetes bacterium]|nr:dCTP deaminase [Planctomycetota bacterium]